MIAWVGDLGPRGALFGHDQGVGIRRREMIMFGCGGDRTGFAAPARVSFLDNGRRKLACNVVVVRLV